MLEVLNYYRDKLAQQVRSFPSWPTATQARSLIDRRVRLEKQIAQFDTESPVADKSIPLLKRLGAGAAETLQDDAPMSDDGQDELQSDDEDDYIDLDWEAAKKTIVPLPSCFDASAMRDRGLEHLLLLEKELREAQMNDALHLLRHSLGDKAWLLRRKLRGVKGYKEKLAIRTSVTDKMQDVERHAATYNRGREALMRMGFAGEWMPISKSDLQLSSDVSEANRIGQNREKLPWFWCLEQGIGAGHVKIESSW